MRPFWLEFIEDESSWDEDRQWMIGSGLLVKPVLEEKAKELSIYLPGKRQVRKQSIREFAKDYRSGTTGKRTKHAHLQEQFKCQSNWTQLVYIIEEVNTSTFFYPYSQLAGTIIPKLSEVKLTTKDNHEQPIILYIAVNQKGDFANGTIYLDDGESYAYENGDYAHWGFTFKKYHSNILVKQVENFQRAWLFAHYYKQKPWQKWQVR